MNLQAFWHVAIMGSWNRVVREQSALLFRSQLSPRIGVVGGKLPEEYSPLVAFSKKSAAEHEAPTLYFLWRWLRAHSDEAVLYMHTKGVSRKGRRWTHWRHLMEKWVVEHWRENLTLLDRYDVVGVDYREKPLPHFAGNFWIARRDWINKLPSIYEYRDTMPANLRKSKGKRTPWERWCCEFWLLSRTGARIASLCCTGERLGKMGVARKWLNKPYSLDGL